MPRIAFYSHDTFGLGHFRRCLKLAAAIAPAVHPSRGLFVTGSPWTHLFPIPDRFGLLHLPAVVKQGCSYRPRSGPDDLAAVVSLRSRRISSTLQRFRPDLVIVDNVPAGLGGEILPALRRLAGSPARPRMVLALRDVLDDLPAVGREWSGAAVQQALPLFDELWMFGDESDVQRLRSAVPLGEATAVIACGHLETGPPCPAPGIRPPWVRFRRPHDRECGTRAGTARRPRVLVTTGGGGDGGHLIETFLEMLRTRRIDADSRVVLGPDFPAAELARLHARNGFRARIDTFVPDLQEVIAGADVVVSMAGYNTVCEIRAAGRRTVYVPRVWPRREQLIRARREQAENRAKVVHPEDLTPATLAAAIEESLDSPPPRPARFQGGLVAAHRAVRLLDIQPSEALG